ncbi:DUF1585 domain-containing protein [Pendulispora albinea]|uniref:DUF1585 domain-containing protein n=1 Tax=Pendulispora albinea TaxID=2741071 RepID=A0ABZ2M2S0_9BACT
MRKARLLVPLLASGALGWAADAGAAPSLDDYRRFRALTVDLVGRIPTRDEVAAFEKPGFDLEGWINQRLTGPGYADRVTRIYSDLLRLQVSPVFNALNSQVDLRRELIRGPNNEQIYVYYRLGQRRQRAETDGDFCLTSEETGITFPVNRPRGTYPDGGAPGGKAVPATVLDKATLKVKPWWLYRDYKSANPTDRFDPAKWPAKYGFEPNRALLVEPTGDATVEIRVCREEAQEAEVGKVYASGRTAGDAGALPPGRTTALPLDDSFATANQGKPISCRTQSGISHSIDCGCGKGLEHCFPTPGFTGQDLGVVAPEVNILGAEAPIDSIAQDSGDWDRLWWGEEARHFMLDLFGKDRDFRELLSSPRTFVNGPLMQYYKSDAPGTCCGAALFFGHVEPVPLLDPKSIPGGLLPHDANTWVEVQNRGAFASGILTMPIFLTKYGTRRARAHVLYNAFLCKDFVAPANLQLTPSEDPNLMTREGCRSCHTTLEPMAAYFARVTESGVTYLPPDKLPLDTASMCSPTATNPRVCTCKNDANGKMNGTCAPYYDPAFSNKTHGVLRGGYPDVTNRTNHAEQGPKGMASELVNQPEFAACVAENVASSFLGRSLSTEDAELTRTLTQALRDGGYRMRAVVKKMLLSDAYHRSNNLTSSAWRGGTDGGAR